MLFLTRLDSLTAVTQGMLSYLLDLLMLLLGFSSFLSLYLSLSLLLSLLTLPHLPLMLQGSIGLTVAPQLVNFAKLSDALLMRSLQQLVQTPVINRDVTKSRQACCIA